MIPLLVVMALSSAPPPSIVDAERAYAALAERAGQWTAFRATAAAGAVMFVPDPVDAQAWLKSRADPPVSVKWQPAAAFLSCDGKAGATLGPWQRTSSAGYFSTVWLRTPDGWRWTIDFGDRLDRPLPAAPSDVPIRRASCRRARTELTPKLPRAAKSAAGSSPDHSLLWSWDVAEDGSCSLAVYLWNGATYERVIERTIANRQ